LTTPYFDDCNAQSEWRACSLDTFYEGNHAEAYGNNGTPTAHMFYTQAFRVHQFLNLADGGVNGDQGTMCFSDRGTRSFHMYGRCVPINGNTSASGLSGHSEIQDGYNYAVPDEYWGYQGAANCGTTYVTAPGCSGSYGGQDWFAAMMEEHNNTDFVIGNFMYSYAGAAKYLSVSTTHNTTGIDNSAQGFYAYNTFLLDSSVAGSGGALWEGTRPGTQGSWQVMPISAVQPRAFFVNNILPSKDNTTCAYNCYTFSMFGNSSMTFQSNVVAPGQVTVASNIQPTGWAAGGIFTNGLNTSYSYYDPGNIAPINQFLGGFTAPNFIAYNVFPVNTTTGVPVGGSNAIGAATTLTGQLAYYPPRFNPVTANMDPFTLRVDATTLGSTDPTGAAPPALKFSGSVKLSGTLKLQ
jgi:hypothetical protein